MIRNSTDTVCSFDHRGTRHVRFVIALSGALGANVRI